MYIFHNLNYINLFLAAFYNNYLMIVINLMLLEKVCVSRKMFSVNRAHDFAVSGTLGECSDDSYIIALNHFARGFALAITAFGPPRPQFRMIAMQIEQRFGQSTPFVEALTSFEEPAALSV